MKMFGPTPAAILPAKTEEKAKRPAHESWGPIPSREAPKSAQAPTEPSGPVLLAKLDLRVGVSLEAALLPGVGVEYRIVHDGAAHLVSVADVAALLAMMGAK